VYIGLTIRVAPFNNNFGTNAAGRASTRLFAVEINGIKIDHFSGKLISSANQSQRILSHISLQNIKITLTLHSPSPAQQFASAFRSIPSAEGKIALLVSYKASAARWRPSLSGPTPSRAQVSGKSVRMKASPEGEKALQPKGNAPTTLVITPPAKANIGSAWDNIAPAQVLIPATLQNALYTRLSLTTAKLRAGSEKLKAVAAKVIRKLTQPEAIPPPF